jgi:hypothetical protein
MRRILTVAAAAALATATACGPPPPPSDEDAAEEAEESPAEDEQDDAKEPEEEEYDGAALAADVDDALHVYAADLDWPEVAAMAEAVTLTSPEPGHIVIVVPAEGEVPLLGDAGTFVAEQCDAVPELEQVTIDHTAAGGEEIGPVDVDC